MFFQSGKKILCHSAQPGLPPETLPTYCCLMDTENPAAGLATSVGLPGLSRAKVKSEPRAMEAPLSERLKREVISDRESDLEMKPGDFIAG